VVDDVLKITTREVADTTMFVRTYPVGDVVAPDNDFESLVSTLQQTIAPDSWDQAGGAGSISAVPAARSLVVRQNYENHVQVLELLRTLREARSEADPVESARSGFGSGVTFGPDPFSAQDSLGKGFGEGFGKGVGEAGGFGGGLGGTTGGFGGGLGIPRPAGIPGLPGTGAGLPGAAPPPHKGGTGLPPAPRKE
jgi:hypothetical protein